MIKEPTFPAQTTPSPARPRRNGSSTAAMSRRCSSRRFLIIGQVFYGILESYPKTLLAIGCSIAAEIVLSLLVLPQVPAPRQRLCVRHQLRHPDSLAAGLAVRALSP